MGKNWQIIEERLIGCDLKVTVMQTKVKLKWLSAIGGRYTKRNRKFLYRLQLSA